MEEQAEGLGKLLSPSLGKEREFGWSSLPTSSSDEAPAGSLGGSIGGSLGISSLAWWRRDRVERVKWGGRKRRDGAQMSIRHVGWRVDPVECVAAGGFDEKSVYQIFRARVESFGNFWITLNLSPNLPTLSQKIGTQLSFKIKLDHLETSKNHETFSVDVINKVQCILRISGIKAISVSKWKIFPEWNIWVFR